MNTKTLCLFRVIPSMYPGCQSVYCTKKHLAASCPSKAKKAPHVISSQTVASDYCECTARKCVWYMFDNDLVLPEYIVAYEYLTAVSITILKREFLLIDF